MWQLGISLLAAGTVIWITTNVAFLFMQETARIDAALKGDEQDAE